MVKEQHPQAVKESTDRILPVWIEAFKVLLNASPLNDIENVQSWDSLAIRIEIFKVYKLFFFTRGIVVLRFHLPGIGYDPDGILKDSVSTHLRPP